MQVVQLKTSLAGRRFAHNVGSLVAMPEEMAEDFIVRGLATSSDADPDGDDVAAYGQAADTIDVTQVDVVPEAGHAPPPSGGVSVVEPQPPASTWVSAPGSTVTGLGPEHASRTGPEPADVATATGVDLSGEEPPGDRVADLRAWVGRSPERARKALDAEQAKPDNEQRPSLIAHLRSIADA